MRTWTMSRDALLRNGISVQPHNDYAHIMEQNKSIMYDKQVDESINQS